MIRQQKRIFTSKNFFSKLFKKHEILWNDGPNLKGLIQDLLNKVSSQWGKEEMYGVVWDILSMENLRQLLYMIAMFLFKELLAELVYPVANPKFNLILARVIIKSF